VWRCVLICTAKRAISYVIGCVQAFALDTWLRLMLPVTFDELIAPVRDRVMASGERLSYAARPSH
jgi:hypothetical protein